MALDLYTPCPCGSGKKFKWCCQPIHVDIDRAFRQDQEGQHEAALRTMDEVIAANPGPVSDFKSGKPAALNFLKGQVMKLSKGKANPQLAEQLLRERLSG